jgi:ATP-dependent DNA helicase DinG
MRVVALEGADDLVEQTAQVIAQLARRLGGRTLGLFTSLRRMHQVAQRLAQLLRGEGIEILTPRRSSDDPRGLVDRFARARGGAVLLGARTFWQGLDIPGPALEAVVIEKLPFDVPNELRRRREDRLRGEGLDAFDRFSLGKMLLHLKQMTGRLIRTEEDRGIVVIVDGRVDRGYFRKLGRALPPDVEVQVVPATDCGEKLPGILDQIRLGSDDPTELTATDPES